MREGVATYIRTAARSPAALRVEARRVCEAAFGRSVEGVESFPAAPGRMHETVRVRLDGGRSVMATRRSHAGQGRNEASVLKALGEQGAPVPRILAYDGQWLLHEDVGRVSLEHILNDASRTDGAVWLERGLAALNCAHEAARAAAIRFDAEPADRAHAQLRADLGRVSEVSEWLGLEIPDLDERELPCPLGVEGRDLVKGDVNPADFIVGRDGRVRLVDWEFCRGGSALEEVARFVASPSVPRRLVSGLRLAESCPYAFAAHPDPVERDVVLIVAGVAFMIRRLRIVLAWRRAGGRWGARQAVRHGLPGIGRTAVRRLCGKGGDWAAKLAFTQPLVPWFEAVAERLLGGKPPS